MTETTKKSPNHTYQALALMSRLFYEKYGDDTLPVIRDVWYKMGLASGELLKQPADYDFKTAAAVLIERDKKIGYMGLRYRVSDELYRMTAPAGKKCDVGLEGCGRPICEAVMAVSVGQFKSICGLDVAMEIITCCAAGDACCDVIFRPLSGSGK
jgi:hypothetical protein